MSSQFEPLPEDVEKVNFLNNFLQFEPLPEYIERKNNECEYNKKIVERANLLNIFLQYNPHIIKLKSDYFDLTLYFYDKKRKLIYGLMLNNELKFFIPSYEVCIHISQLNNIQIQNKCNLRNLIKNACIEGDITLFEQLFQNNENIDFEYILYVILDNNKIDLLIWLWKYISENTNIYLDPFEYFYLACTKGCIDICKWIYEHQIDRTCIDYKKIIIDSFIMACKNCHIDICKWLWNSKIFTINDLDINILYEIVVKNHDIEMCKWLWEISDNNEPLDFDKFIDDNIKKRQKKLDKYIQQYIYTNITNPTNDILISQFDNISFNKYFNEQNKDNKKSEYIQLFEQNKNIFPNDIIENVQEYKNINITFDIKTFNTMFMQQNDYIKHGSDSFNINTY